MLPQLIGNQQAELERLDGLVIDANRRLSALQLQIREARAELQDCEAAVNKARDAAYQRTAALDMKEQDLHGRERILLRDRQDFLAEKKRWIQTRELQS